jgi:DNA-binding XRE family transcriptional regulator
MTVNQKLYKLRKELGLKQADFAKLIGVSKQTVSRYEQDGESVPFNVQVRIVKTFNLPSNAIYDDNIMDGFDVTDNSDLIKRIKRDYDKLPTEGKMEVLKFILEGQE